MLDTPASVLGFTAAAFLLGSLAPVALESRERATASLVSSSKGDRLPLPAPSQPRSAVSTIEVQGLGQATVVFKSRDGQVLFRSDPISGTTQVARDVDLPVVTFKDEPAPPSVPVVQQPEPKREGSNPPATEPRTRKPIGCEAPVSALARSEAARVPGLCLAGLAGRASS